MTKAQTSNRYAQPIFKVDDFALTDTRQTLKEVLDLAKKRKKTFDIGIRKDAFFDSRADR